MRTGAELARKPYAPLVTGADLATIRAEIEATLDRIDLDEEELTAVGWDALARGVRLTRRDESAEFATVAGYLHWRYPRTFDLGQRLLKLLSEADSLGPQEAGELDALVTERLRDRIM